MIRLFGWMMLAVLLFGCGGRPLDAGTTEQAVTFNSPAPPGGWGTQPWLCSPQSWNPIVSNNWPVNGWCSWQPDPNSGLYPPHVSTCAWSPDPIWNGTIYIYSENNFGGSCAMIWADTTPLIMNVDLVEVNGWHSQWTPPGGTLQYKNIKSMKIGPYTSAYLCSGPFTGPPGAPCNLYPSMGLGSFASGAGYPNMLTAGGLYFETAAIQLQATR